MLSHSAIIKLKAILIIDLIVVGVAAGVYLYLLDQGAIASGAKPATFILNNLTIEPLEAYVGEAVQISVNITNIGDLEGNHTLNLEINNEVKGTSNVTLAGNSTEIIEFTDIETAEGNYTVKVGDLLGSFNIKPAPPESSKIILSNLKVNPYEVWVNEAVTVTATAENPSAETETLTVRIMVDDSVVDSQIISLNALESQTVEFTVNASSEGKHTLKVNTLAGSFTIVKTGFHTLTINRSGGGSTPLPFTLNGEEQKTAYTALLPVGEYSISVPNPFSVGTGVLEFTYWSDGVRSPSRTFTLESRLILVVTYTLISGYASCPSLFIWNGTGYTYVTEISNAGWLGYISHINSDGKIVFGGGNPWDYIKLDKDLISTRDGYFDMALFQQWDELYYLDSAYMIVVDHQVGTDVHSTMSNYLNQGLNDKIYTVNKSNLFSPITAVNEKGESVLAQISQIDRVFTQGSNGLISPSWDNITLNQITLNLGNLSSANEIKLVVNGMVDWGLPGPYYDWIDGFTDAAAQGLLSDGTQIYPAPYLQVKNSDGSWVRVEQKRQMPMPADFNARSFVVNLTGIFPLDVIDYEIRITNFFNVTFDYIGIDISTEQNITMQKITPTAVLNQIWETQSPSTGLFTRYGDVTSLLQNADDMYVIGRQGDQVNLQFSTADLTPPTEGIERDYFFIVACWFKDPPEGWGYSFDFTVDPLPFIAMSGFPYPSSETYPYDPQHLAYLNEYNTRAITAKT